MVRIRVNWPKERAQLGIFTPATSFMPEKPYFQIRDCQDGFQGYCRCGEKQRQLFIFNGLREYGLAVRLLQAIQSRNKMLCLCTLTYERRW